MYVTWSVLPAFFFHISSQSHTLPVSACLTCVLKTCSVLIQARLYLVSWLIQVVNVLITMKNMNHVTPCLTWLPTTPLSPGYNKLPGFFLQGTWALLPVSTGSKGSGEQRLLGWKFKELCSISDPATNSQVSLVTLLHTLQAPLNGFSKLVRPSQR